MSIEYAPQFESIVSKARAEGKRMRVALAGADSESILRGVFEAEADGFVEPILIGNFKRIQEMTERIGVTGRSYDLQPLDDSTNVVQYAIEMIKAGSADCLMRGDTSTRDFLMPVLNKANHLLRKASGRIGCDAAHQPLGGRPPRGSEEHCARPARL